MADLAQQIRARLDGWAPPGPWLNQFTEAEPRTPEELAAVAEELGRAIEAGAFAGPVLVLPPSPKFYPGFEQMSAALLAATAHHGPVPSDVENGIILCACMYDSSDHHLAERYPCPELRDIAQALGIEVDRG